MVPGVPPVQEHDEAGDGGLARGDRRSVPAEAPRPATETDVASEEDGCFKEVVLRLQLRLLPLLPVGAHHGSARRLSACSGDALGAGPEALQRGAPRPVQEEPRG